jgi:hypothetical protein
MLLLGKVGWHGMACLAITLRLFSYRSTYDRVAYALHSYFLTAGYKLVATGKAADDLEGTLASLRIHFVWPKNYDIDLLELANQCP